MEFIQEYVVDKNVTCIDQLTIHEIISKISSLFENNENDILLCHHENLNYQQKIFLEMLFKIPNSNKIISLFYKKDYFYFYNDNFNKNALLNFLHDASFDNISQCYICYNNVENQEICIHCSQKICLSCYNKIDTCPYCRKKMIV